MDFLIYVLFYVFLIFNTFYWIVSLCRKEGLCVYFLFLFPVKFFHDDRKQKKTKKLISFNIINRRKKL